MKKLEYSVREGYKEKSGIKVKKRKLYTRREDRNTKNEENEKL